MVNNSKDYIRYINKPSFVSQKIFKKNCCYSVLIIDKQIYVGFSILDLSKLLIYEFHYKYIESKCSANLLFSDTDSLVYEIKTDDVYENFYENKTLFDFSDYPQDSKFFYPVNEKVIGKMKDKFKGKIISEFIELKSKMYSLIDADGKENQKAKGVNKNVVKNIKT